MNIRYYIQLDELQNIINSTCVVDDTILGEEWILINADDWHKISQYKKYNKVEGLFYDERVIEEFRLEEIVMETHLGVLTNSEDTLINMELNTDTNTKVTTTGSDSLLLMEMLVTIDEKLTQLLSPKQA